MRYTDPSGHCTGDPDDKENSDLACWQQLENITKKFSSVEIDPDNWKKEELEYIYEALLAIENSTGSLETMKFVRVAGNSSYDIMCQEDGCNPALTIGKTTWFYDSSFSNESEAIYNTLHEYGHVYDRKDWIRQSDYFENQFWDDCPFINGRCFLWIGGPVGATTTHGASNPGEDFADSFAVAVWTQNFDIEPASDTFSTPIGGTTNPYLPYYIFKFMPSQERIDYMIDLFSQ